MVVFKYAKVGAVLNDLAGFNNAGGFSRNYAINYIETW